MNNPMYSIATNCKQMPMLRARFRPIKSIRKRLHVMAATNLTIPNTAVVRRLVSLSTGHGQSCLKVSFQYLRSVASKDG